MKPLVILSDINGLFLPQIITSTDNLNKYNEIHQLDSLTLAGLHDKKDKENSHQYLINKGIDEAANALVLKYPNGIAVGLGLSIGGAILWRAIGKGLNVDYLLCFSSTRLRFETTKHLCRTTLYFGELDSYRPDQLWFQKLNLKENVLSGQGHEFYLSQLALDIFSTELQNFYREPRA